jgi:tripartite-type tricarboxylate transporter receptor subunit TctC
MPQVRSGKVRALAVTSLQASGALPGISTMASQGFPDFEAIS